MRRLKISAAVQQDYDKRSCFPAIVRIARAARTEFVIFYTREFRVTDSQAKALLDDAEIQAHNPEVPDSIKISYKILAINARRLLRKPEATKPRADPLAIVSGRFRIDNKMRAAGEKESDYD